MAVALEVSIEWLAMSHHACDVEMISSHGQADSMGKVTVVAFIFTL
jgi:hypothetical protein